MNVHSLIILIFIGILLNSNYGVESVVKKNDQDIVHITTANSADVTIISQLVVIFYAISKCINGQSISTATPIGYVAKYLFVANCNCSHLDDQILVFNKMCGRIICIVSKKELFRVISKYQKEIDEASETINISIFFNELLSINNKKLSESSKKLFSISGNIFAELLGFGTFKSSILFNINGCLLYSLALPKRDCMIPKTTLIKHFIQYTNPIELSINLTATSVLIDGATAFNELYIFSDSSNPRPTCSGLMASHLIGNKLLLKQILIDITALVNTLSGSKRDKLLAYFLYLIAIDEPFKYSIEEILSDLYADQHSGCIDNKSKKRNDDDDDDERNRRITTTSTTEPTTTTTTTTSIPPFWNIDVDETNAR